MIERALLITRIAIVDAPGSMRRVAGVSHPSEVASMEKDGDQGEVSPMPPHSRTDDRFTGCMPDA